MKRQEVSEVKKNPLTESLQMLDLSLKEGKVNYCIL